MNLTEAKKELRREFGKRAFWRVNPKAPNAEQREKMRERVELLKKDRDELEAARDARRAEILASDARYQELRKAAKEKRDALDELRGTLSSRRVEFGKVTHGLFNVVEGSGDTWAEAFAQYRARIGKR
jgi:hypothetical protein